MTYKQIRAKEELKIALKDTIIVKLIYKILDYLENYLIKISKKENNIGKL